MKILSDILLKAGLVVEGVTDLQGTSTALTPSLSDNSNKIATTAFVKGQGYLTAEADTLNSVTSRGNTTSNSITVQNLSATGLIVSSGAVYSNVGFYSNNNGNLRYTFDNNDLVLRAGTSTSNEYLRVFGATGNVGINTGVDAGYKLDVVGNVRSAVYFSSNGTIAAPVIGFNVFNQVQVDIQGYGAITTNFLKVGAYLAAVGRIEGDAGIIIKGGTTAVNSPFISYGIGRPDAPAGSGQALAGMGGIFDGGILWPSGIGLSFFIKQTADITDGSPPVEKMRITSSGDVRLFNLAGTGTRMVVADSSGVLSTQAVPPTITNYVTTDTTQTISGQKTFSALTTIFDSTQSATFIEGKASGVLYGGISFSLFMQFNAYAAATGGYLWKNGAGNNVMALSQTGALTISNLAGSGNRMVVADANGVLSTQAISSGITGSLTSGYIPKATGASSLADGLIYDTGSAVLIGTQTASSAKFMVYSTTPDNHYQAVGSAPSFRFADTITSPTYTGIVGLATASNHFIIGAAAGDMVLSNNTTSSIGNFLFGTGSTERMRISPAGNVSINNTNNTFRFDVTGTVRFTGQLRLESTITNGTHTYTLPSGTGTLALTSDIPSLSGYVPTSRTITINGVSYDLSADRSWTVTGGVSGTGTTNYLPKFTGTSTIGNSLLIDQGSYVESTANMLISNASTYRGLSITTATASARPTLSFVNSNYAQYGSYIQDINGRLAFGRMNYDFGGHSEAMTLNASGNLSIGNTNDTYKLDVSGTGIFRKVNGDSRIIVYQTGTAPYTATLELSSQTLGTYGGVVQYDGGSENLTIQNYGRSASGLSRGDIKFNTKISNTTATDVFVLNGYTGAATFSSSIDMGLNKLFSGGGYKMLYRNSTVNITYSGTSNWQINNDADNVALMTVLNGGNVGIGTTSPTALLHLSSGTPYIYLDDTSTSGTRNRFQILNGDVGTTQTVTFGFNNTSGTNLQEVIAFNENGRVGIGTTSPSEKLFISSSGLSAGIGVSTITSGDPYVRLYDSTTIKADIWWGRSGAYMGINSLGSSSITAINPFGGAVGIGTTSPQTELHVKASSGWAEIRIDGASGSAASLEYYSNGMKLGDLYCDTSANMIFRNNTSNERMRITNVGDVLVNATMTTQSAKFYVNGKGAFGSLYIGNLSTGTVYSNMGNLTNTNPSDFRLKNTIKPLTYGLNEVLQLNPKTFYYNDDATRARLKYGFIAQEVKEVMPDMVRLLGNEDYLGLESEGIWVTLVNAIKEQQAQINELKSQLNK